MAVSLQRTPPHVAGEVAVAAGGGLDTKPILESFPAKRSVPRPGKGPSMEFTGSHILTIDQFQLADVRRIFAAAESMEPYAQRKKRSRVLEGALLGNLFFEASTRSRFSFASAFERLGGAVRDMTGFEHTSFQKGESIH